MQSKFLLCNNFFPSTFLLFFTIFDIFFSSIELASYYTGKSKTHIFPTCRTIT